MGHISRSLHPAQAIQTTPRGREPYVVVVFGRTGVGVSSLVNLIIGHPVSKDHPNAATTTRKLTSHLPIGFPGSNKQFCLYEVPGFCGKLPDKRILEAIQQVDEREGIDLFIYCLRKQKATVMPKIVRDIREKIGEADIPMIAVVTELERFETEGRAQDWWETSVEGCGTNGALIEGMCFGGRGNFDAHACVTTLPPREVDLRETLRKLRDRSEERLRRLILEMCEGQKRKGE